MIHVKICSKTSKPPTFDGNNAEYQTFVSIFESTLALSVLLANADGQMRSRTKSDFPGSSDSAGRSIFAKMHTDVLLVNFDHERVCEPLSVPLKNPTEQKHSRYAPDTQNRQYALMQRIMMLVKTRCGHTEGFESSLRAGECVSRTALADAAKDIVMVNMAPVFLKNNLHVGTCTNRAALRTARLQWCYYCLNVAASSITSAGNGKRC